MCTPKAPKAAKAPVQYAAPKAATSLSPGARIQGGQQRMTRPASATSYGDKRRRAPTAVLGANALPPQPMPTAILGG